MVFFPNYQPTQLKMIPTKDYYTAPSQEVFDDIKQGATKLWNTYDNTYHYVDEKVNQIKDMTNIRDNYAYIVAMFDCFNQVKLIELVELPESKELVARLIN
jgi:virulence-associated protein VapD